jgi:WD40 repeat protein
LACIYHVRELYFMPDLFISYSRRNDEFVRKLHKVLADAGKDIWIDFEDIPLSSSWWEEIREGIESSDTFVFVITPESVASPICNFEIAHAVSHNKRIVPIVRQMLDVEDGYTLVLKQQLNDSEVQILGGRNLEEVARITWGNIARHNWLFFHEDEETKIAEGVQKLLNALETDLDHVRTHTRLLLRAREWENSGEKPGMLLTLGETTEAETWLAGTGEKTPHPTSLHIEYVHASRLKHRRGQRQILVAISVALVITFILALVSLGFYVEADYQGNLAETNAAEANTQFHIAETNAQNAVLNAATATFALGEAESNAREAQIQANLAATSAQNALDNAATAQFAQEKAELNGTQAANNAAAAEIQAQLVVTQVQIARDRAFEAATAQAQAEENEEAAQTQAAIAQINFVAAETARAESQVNAAQAQTEAARAEAQATVAESNRRDAIRAQDNVAIERDRARSIALAALAESELGLNTGDIDPELAINLGIAALERFGVTWQAERALGFAVANTLRPNTLLQHASRVTALELSANGQWMVSADDTGVVLIWDATTFRVLHRLNEHTDTVTSVSFSPDGSRVLTTSRDTRVRIWDTATGTAVQRLRGHTESVLGGLWSPDGTRVLTFSADNTVRIWDTATGEEMTRLNHNGLVRSADWSSDSALIVTGAQDGLARVWSPDGTLISTYNGHLLTAREESDVAITTVAFAPADERIATGGTDENVHVWNARTAETITVLEGHRLDITRVYWSANGNWLASIDGLNATDFTEENASARIWGLQDETNRFAIFDHIGVVVAAAWSPNDARLATVGGDGFLYISDAASGGQLLGLGENQVITVVAWAADGSALITGNERGTVRVWDYWANAAELVDYARFCCNPRALTDEEARHYGLPIPTSVPADSIEIVQCNNGSLPQRLYPGTRGQVITTGDPSPVNVRHTASRGARINAQIPPGQTFRVIAGPFCDDTTLNPIVWFQIQFGLNAETGFIAEGERGAYFVEPLP